MMIFFQTEDGIYGAIKHINNVYTDIDLPIDYPNTSKILKKKRILKKEEIIEKAKKVCFSSNPQDYIQFVGELAKLGRKVR